ncbi:MAG TPA: hypothetical protein VGH28_13725 [Polyangiaceae bacterium]
MIGKDPRPSEDHMRRVREMHAFLTPALREVARQHGYALAVHGSLERDIDLIAVPWRDHPTSAEALIDGLFAVIKAVVHATWSGGRDEKPPAEQKPHGRLAWSIVCGGGPYFDISVMPRVVAPKEKPKRARK